MQISAGLLTDLQILASLVMIVAAVITIILKYRGSLSPLKAVALLDSSMILNAAFQLPGRSLNGADGIIVVLDLVAIVAGLIALFVLLWKAESVSSNETVKPGTTG